MTIADFMRAAVPPAPETPLLRRLRQWTTALTLLAGVFSGAVAFYGVSYEAVVLALPVLLLGAFGSNIAYWRLKKRREDAYWTPRRIDAHFLARDVERRAREAAERKGRAA